LHKETSEAAIQFILQPQHTADPQILTNVLQSCSNFLLQDTLDYKACTAQSEFNFHFVLKNRYFRPCRFVWRL